ncbi:nuclear pore complex protein Nup205-like isoform X2 [Artemia franciscana]|uniref:Nuclear pore complex protein Nup205 n=1 Tax=Artemia franciscana TaxID=6661 RepID=A0AA88I6A0_ARTSF|nr:hypothetical protein QYM36_004524 [Artemia franciscana]
MTSWTSFKDLLKLSESVILGRNHELFPDFESMLRKQQGNFYAILKNPEKDSKYRDLLKKAVKEPVQIPGWQTAQTLPASLVNEACILSDMYNLDELVALSLLVHGEEQAPIYPGLKRGLISVLLYYDAKYSQSTALKLIVQAERGVHWTYSLTDDVLNFLTQYTNQLFESGLFERLLDVHSEFTVTKEMELLSTNQALGPPRHRRQLMDYIKKTRMSIADIIFSRAAQRGLSLAQTLRLIDYLSEVEPDKEGQPSGEMSNVILLLALLYAFDLSVIHRHDEGEELAKDLPIVKDKSYVSEISKVLDRSGKTWKNPGYQGLAQLAWATTLAALRSIPEKAEDRFRQEFEQDEHFVDLALANKAFVAISELIKNNSLLILEEFYIKRLHYLLTDLIVLMPLKIKELRNKAEETARTLIVYEQEGLVPPAHLPQHFENLLEAIASVYNEDPLDLNLCLEFWYSSDYHGPQRNNARQMALNKFVRLAGDLLPPSLYIPYTRMLGSLANSPRAAHYVFNLLKQNGVGQASTVSWDHFFSTLARYLANLRQETFPVQDTVYRQRGTAIGGITAQEMVGFQEILRLTRIVASHDDVARVSLAENPVWTPLVTFLGLVTCSVPLLLKADLLKALSAFAKSRDIASTLWYYVEMAQVIPTAPSTSKFPQRGIHTDLEEVESRSEEYPVSRGFLELLNALVEVDVPLHLGAPNRTPGIDPYVKFVVESVLMKSHSRAYKKSSDKWQICELAVKFLHKLLMRYEPAVGDIQHRERDAPQQPGYSVLVAMLQDSPLLKMILYLIEESVRHFDEYVDFPERKACERTALSCLNIFNRCIQMQEIFLEMVRSEGSSLRVTSLGTLLLGVNQRTNRPDHMLKIAKFVSYGSEYMPDHAVEAASILAFVASIPSAQQQLLALFTEEPNDVIIRHGIVEILDDAFENEEQGRKVKLCLLKMLQQGVNLPHPSLVHFLLGFSIQKPLQKSQLQNPGVYGTPKNCLHSLLNILDENLKGLVDAAVVMEGYKLLHVILSHGTMSYPVLRFLKGNLRNFLVRHGEALPFSASPTMEQQNSTAHLLLCIAIDIRVSSLRGSTSQAQKLASVIFTSERTVDIADGEAGQRRDAGISNLLSRTFASITGMPFVSRPRVLALLDSVDVSQLAVPIPELELFDLGQLQSLLKECEMPSEDGGPSVVNVRHLQRRVERELSALEGTMALAQRQAIMQEFKIILKYSIEANGVKQQMWTRRCFIDSWRQLIETILLSTTNYSNDILVQIIQEVLRKCVQDSASQELNQPLCGLLVIAVTSLRVQAMKKQESQLTDSLVAFLDERRTDLLSEIGMSPSALRVILKGIVEWILKTGPSAQRIRINLYTALIGCLRLSAVNPSRDSRGLGGGITAGLQAIGVETVLEYGDSFLSALFRDSASGHDVQRMLALSLLDTIISQAPIGPVASYAAKHGYIRHLLDILSGLDESLISLVCQELSVMAMKYLQLYSSIMSFFTRMALTSRGSQLLLDCNLLGRLSEMNAFSHRPQAGTMDEYAFLSSPFHRFQEILFPAFSLCLAMLSGLGSEHRIIREQVLGFLLAHSETISSILRSGQTLNDLHHLEELSLLTNVISKATNIEVIHKGADGTNEIRDQIERLQTICLSLLPAYVPTDVAIDRVLRFSGVEDDPNSNIARHKATSMYLQVCLNLLNIVMNMTADGTRIYSRTVFTASFTMADFGAAFTGTRPQTTRSVALGVVVNIISAAAKRLKTTEVARDTLSRKLEVVESLPVDEINQFVSKMISEGSSISEKREAARQTLTKVVESQVVEITQCRFILEVSLVLLWKHMEAFVSTNNTINASRLNISFDASFRFKEDITHYLDETFYKQVEEASKVSGTAGKPDDFNLLFIRRIRKIAQG